MRAAGPPSAPCAQSLQPCRPPRSGRSPSSSLIRFERGECIAPVPARRRGARGGAAAAQLIGPLS
eukprot:8758075-Pyramimonas_sp.AAC.1